MNTVDAHTEAKRSRKLGLIFTCFLICIPAIGQIIGVFTVLPFLLAAVFTKSANRLADFGVLLIFLALYFIVPTSIFLFIQNLISSGGLMNILPDAFFNFYYFLKNNSFAIPLLLALTGQFVVSFIGLKRFDYGAD